MKNIIFIIAIALTVSCNYKVTVQKNNKEIKGSGNIVSKTIEVGSISEIENIGVLNIFLTEGAKQEIRIETDDNIMQYVKYEVKNNKLTFSIKNDIENLNISPTKSNIYITSNQISLISNVGVGEINIEKYNIVNNLQIINSGVGSINSNNITGNNLVINNSGVGSINLKGTLDSLTLNHSGVGSINTEELATNTLSLHNSGVGNASLYAIKEISIESSGIGTIEFKGNPVVKTLDISGAGKIKNVKN